MPGRHLLRQHGEGHRSRGRPSDAPGERARPGGPRRFGLRGVLRPHPARRRRHAVAAGDVQGDRRAHGGDRRPRWRVTSPSAAAARPRHARHRRCWPVPSTCSATRCTSSRRARGCSASRACSARCIPASTVLLARLVYGERLRPIQRVGLVVAVAGVGPRHRRAENRRRRTEKPAAGPGLPVRPPARGSQLRLTTMSECCGLERRPGRLQRLAVGVHHRGRVLGRAEQVAQLAPDPRGRPRGLQAGQLLARGAQRGERPSRSPVAISAWASISRARIVVTEELRAGA